MSDDKFQPLRDAGTAGPNYGVTNEQVVDRLAEWDRKFGLDLSDIDRNRVVVQFRSTPADVAPLADELYRLCPDLIDQHYAAFGVMYEDDDPADLPPGVAELIDGLSVDTFEEEHEIDGPTEYGLELLRRALQLGHPLPLWWD
ncbi:DUF4253 domain-containing protein [Alienimonas chondri]|uniref:DUF4253 domain-containing protein n=1 Tax=Alienimonas chondri TaxID=2681879 RepID=A0ABX1VCU2_9PLAN|nr:DUF4253 domain-containing protein [Alienimonas chondri]NNJ25930.1 hypothetical protein [Alienimonas chondri]